VVFFENGPMSEQSGFGVSVSWQSGPGSPCARCITTIVSGCCRQSCRTSGGHRCYTSKDVVQLQRIIALRSCGLSLEEIGAVLSAGADGGLADLLRRQLEVVDERIRQAVALRIRLLGILDALDQTVGPSITRSCD
jgi:MerR, DNA binding